MAHGRKIAVIGLGYVGLPVAVAFARAGVRWQDSISIAGASLNCASFMTVPMKSRLAIWAMLRFHSRMM